MFCSETGQAHVYNHAQLTSPQVDHSCNGIKANWRQCFRNAALKGGSSVVCCTQWY
jgi:hypothetical protein